MKPFDETLIDPEPDVLLAKLVKATKTANGRVRERRLIKEADAWRRFLRRNRNQHQGSRIYAVSVASDSARVEVSWWTDYVGRKHWCIVGKRTDYRDRMPRSALAKEGLWHIYPERLARRTRDGRSEAVAVCACGAAGTLSSLGWSGPSCGPCHDRRLEELPPAVPHFSMAKWDVPWGMKVFVIASDGRVLAACYDGQLVIWEPESDTADTSSLPDSGSPILAVSSRGVIAYAKRTTLAGSLWLLGPHETVWRPLWEDRSPGADFAFSPDGSRLLCLGTPPSVLELDSTPLVLREIHSTGLIQAVWLDQDTILTIEKVVGLVRIDIITGERTILREGVGQLFPDLDFDSLGQTELRPPLACSADSQWVAVGGANVAEGLHLCHLPTRRWWNLALPGHAEHTVFLQFTENGQLIHIEEGGWFQLWDPAERRLLGTLEFGVLVPWGNWMASPDGERLGFHAFGVLHVWDWRPLLESP